jgi:hypothetical protein
MKCVEHLGYPIAKHGCCASNIYFCTWGYNILLKYWYDTNLPVEWIGLGPWVYFYKKQGAKI